jgi:hypothetical protein
MGRHAFHVYNTKQKKWVRSELEIGYATILNYIMKGFKEEGDESDGSSNQSSEELYE